MSLHIACALVAVVLATGTAHAAEGTPYPNRPVRFIVPVAAGGGTDLLARTLSVRLAETLGQPLVVDNRSGAGGTIGVDIAVRAVPDGYTILMGYFAPIGVAPSLYKLPYDPARDLSGVSLLATSQNLLAVHPSIPANTVKELIVLLKAKPRQLTFGSGGVGSAMHVSAELFNLLAQVNMVHVPYKGAGPVVIDLIGGQISLAFVSLPSSLPFVKSGKVRALAVAGKQRSVALPDVPTVDESGLPGFESSQWYGVQVPRQTPRAIIDKLHREFVATLAIPEMRTQLVARGYELVGSTPAEFDQFVRDEIAKWTKVVKAAGIKGQ